MKKLILGLALVVMIGLPAGCATMEETTYSNPAQAINVGVGQGFNIALDSNPTTGYSWEAQFDSTVIELVEKRYQTSEAAGTGIVGAGGTETFEFKARTKGETKITMTYKRRWESEHSDKKVFTVRID